MGRLNDEIETEDDIVCNALRRFRKLHDRILASSLASRWVWGKRTSQAILRFACDYEAHLCGHEIDELLTWAQDLDGIKMPGESR